MDKDKVLTKAEYKAALDVQDACNLSGVVHSFERIICLIWDEARSRGEGTAFVNEHPICKMFTDKMADLARVRGMDAYSGAYDKCKEMVS